MEESWIRFMYKTRDQGVKNPYPNQDKAYGDKAIQIMVEEEQVMQICNAKRGALNSRQPNLIRLFPLQRYNQYIQIIQYKHLK